MDLVSPLLVAIPVIDVDGTLFVQLGIFLGLVIVLGPLLFKPWLEAQARRSEAIDGALARSVAMRAEADALARNYDEQLEAARERTYGLRADSRRTEESTQAKALATVRDEANRALALERERITADTKRAREALGERVGELAHQITIKLLGRAA